MLITKILVIDQSEDFFREIVGVISSYGKEEFEFQHVKGPVDENGEIQYYDCDFIFKSVYPETVLEHTLKLSQSIPVIFFVPSSDQVKDIEGLKKIYFIKDNIVGEDLYKEMKNQLAGRQEVFSRGFIKDVIFKMTMDDITEGIWIVDLGFNTILANKAARNYLGSLVDHPRMTFDAEKGFFVCEEDSETIIEEENHPMKLGLRGDKVENKIIMVKHLDTSTGNWLDVSVRPLRDFKRKIFAGVMTINDFTKRKLKDIEIANKMTELHLQREKFELVLATMRDGVVLIDSDGKTLLCNEAARRLLGPRSQNMTECSDPWNDFAVYEGDGATPFEPENLPTNWALKGQASENIRMYLSHVDSAQGYWLNVTARPLLGVNKGVEGAVIVIHDQTRQKMEEINEKVMIEKLKKSNEEQKKLNIEKNLIMSMVQHDLVNPVGAIQGISELFLVEKFDFDEGKKFIESIFNSTKEMTVMIREMMDIGRIRQQMEDANLELVDLPEIAKNIRPVMSTLTVKKNVALKFEIEEGLPQIYGEKVVLGRILENLVTNAIKFTPENGTVTVGVKKVVKQNISLPQIMLFIKDTGVGMSEEKKETLFGEERKSTVGTEGEKGTGLGLSFVKKGVELHDAVIEIQSEEGKGTSIEIYFPLDAGSLKAA